MLGAQAQVRDWAAAAGLMISAVSGYCDFAQTDQAALAREVERLMVACRAASALGVGDRSSVFRRFEAGPDPRRRLAVAGSRHAASRAPG